jgi:hypothetical protein
VNAAPNDKELIDKAVQITKDHPNFMAELILETAKEIQDETKAGVSTDWRKASLISKFSHEIEKELDTNSTSALKKIDFILMASESWRADLNHWYKHVLIDEGRSFLSRWFFDKGRGRSTKIY